MHRETRRGLTEARRRFGTRVNPTGNATWHDLDDSDTSPDEPTARDYQLAEAEFRAADEPAPDQPRRPKPDKSQGSRGGPTRGDAARGIEEARRRFGSAAVGDVDDTTASDDSPVSAWDIVRQHGGRALAQAQQRHLDQRRYDALHRNPTHGGAA